jgi:hypothetical protein
MVFERAATAWGLVVVLLELLILLLVALPLTALPVIESELAALPLDIAAAPLAELELIALSVEVALLLDILLSLDIALSELIELSDDTALSLLAELAAMPAELSALAAGSFAELSVATVPPSVAELLPVSVMVVVLVSPASEPPRFMSAIGAKTDSGERRNCEDNGKK